MTAIDLSNYFGLAAISLLTLNILVGLLLSTKYNPVRRWPHRRVNTFKIHNWTGYAALAVSLVHPVLILFSTTAHFHVVDLVYPLNAPKQPYINTLGALALYLLIVTVATSSFRLEIGRRIWKPLHFATYALFALYAVHGLLTDPALKDAPLDPLDGEKVFVELCILLVIIGIVLRVRWQLRQPPPRQHRPKRPRAARSAALRQPSSARQVASRRSS
jgi:methionine sulfoxide reductase heme-binding subunit